jgi:hypothetical protein
VTELTGHVVDRVVTVRMAVESGPSFTLREGRDRTVRRYTITEVMIEYRQPATGGPWRCGDVIATGQHPKDPVPRARLWKFGDHDTPDWVVYARLNHYPRWDTSKEGNT